MVDEVKVIDAGSNLMLSGQSSDTVSAKLQSYVDRGSKIVTQLCKVGSTWVAACTVPPQDKSVDDTSTLRVSDFNPASVAAASDLEDGCRVEESGFKRVIYGPSELIVRRRVDHMKQFGATVEVDVTLENGEWVAICDTAGIQNTGYKW